MVQFIDTISTGENLCFSVNPIRFQSLFIKWWGLKHIFFNLGFLKQRSDYKVTDNFRNLVLQDVISNKQWNVDVDVVKIGFFLMKLVEEIRINIPVEQIYVCSNLYI